ncbi:P450 putative-RELATED [Salix koriyanagi]|uniref:P450 putative-RELATED n=1 Tax=Salix koriyanagi TaxID=2511006 RepID=A0A9Q0X4B6_9ROSI|nr:P450 putative-RELATED [Salix koriyanagi]
MNIVSRLQFNNTDCNIYEGSGFITAPYNAYWRFMKKLCMTKLLNTSQINQLVHVREDEMKKLVESMINISKHGESCDLRQAIMTMTNNVICRMSMSTRCLADGATNEAREIKDLALQVSLLGGKLSAGNVMGPLAKLDLFGYGRHLRIALDKFDRLVERIIKEHEEKKMKGTERSEGMDLMDILLEISRDPNAEMELTKKEIKAFFLASCFQLLL